MRLVTHHRDPIAALVPHLRPRCLPTPRPLPPPRQAAVRHASPPAAPPRQQAGPITERTSVAPGSGHKA